MGRRQRFPTRRSLSNALAGATGASLLASYNGSSAAAESDTPLRADEPVIYLRTLWSLAFRADPGTGRIAVVAGHRAPWDGGGGVFIWDEELVDTPADNATVVPSMIRADGKWRRFTVDARPAINARWFGAAGDGSRDDGPALRRALHQVPVGGSLYLPVGVYRVVPVASSLGPWGAGFEIASDDVHLQLAPGAVIRIDGEAPSALFDAAVLCARARGVTIDGGRFETTGSLRHFGVAVLGSDDVEVRDVECRGFGMDGVYVRGHGAGANWIPSRRVQIVGCRFRDVSRAAVGLSGVDSAQVVGCRFEHSVPEIALLGAGIRLDLHDDDDTIRDVEIRGNRCECLGWGISIVGGGEPSRDVDYRIRDVRIHGNEIAGCLSANIAVLGAVIDWSVADNVSRNGLRSGIKIAGTWPRRGEVTNNRCTANGTAGIVVARREGDAQRDIRVTLNRCRSNGAAGIRVQDPRDLMCAGNDCRENAGPGIEAFFGRGTGGGLALLHNTCIDNAECGIALDGARDARCEGNECTGNLDAGIRARCGRDRSPDSVNLRSNTCRRNEGWGIEIEYARTTLCTDNTCELNRGGGIRADVRGEPASLVVRGNACRSNRGVGLEVDDVGSGSTGVVTDNVAVDSSVDDLRLPSDTGLRLRDNVTGSIEPSSSS